LNVSIAKGTFIQAVDSSVQSLTDPGFKIPLWMWPILPFVALYYWISDLFHKFGCWFLSSSSCTFSKTDGY